MTRFLACLALLTAMFPAWAQERHFLYLQADNEQAFYLKLAGETRSSTPAGYLILPRLADTTLEFVVGFPMRKYPEYSFRVVGIDRDRGYALKDFGSKGWGLFDMQSMEVSMGRPVSKGEPAVRQAPILAVRDSFATILASVVRDSAVLDATLIVKQSELEPKPTIPPAARLDSARTSSPAPSAQGVRVLDTARAITAVAERKPPLPSPPPPADSSTVSAKPKAAGIPLRAGKPASPMVDSPGTFRMILPEPLPGKGKAEPKDSVSYVMTGAGTKALRPDSAAMARTGKPASPDASLVRQGIPTEKKTSVSPMKPATAVPETVKLLELSDSSGFQLVFSDRDLQGGLDTISVWIPAGASLPGGVTDKGATRPERTDCQGKVSVSELGQLRRRMEAIPDEDAKVAAALREFRLRCFTTEQVRSLLVVFFREEGRFKLLDAAYPRIFDPQAFLSLESVLKDPYFIHRFRKLAGLQ